MSLVLHQQIGNTPLHYAIRQNSDDVITLLLKYHADPNALVNISHASLLSQPQVIIF